MALFGWEPEAAGRWSSCHWHFAGVAWVSAEG